MERAYISWRRRKRRALTLVVNKTVQVLQASNYQSVHRQNILCFSTVMRMEEHLTALKSKAFGSGLTGIEIAHYLLDD